MKDFIENMDTTKLRYCNSIVSVCILVLLIIASCKNELQNSVQSEIDKTGEKYVPDGRLGIYNIKSKTGDEHITILKGETTSQTAKNELISTLNNSGISLIDSIIILPDTINNHLDWGLVTLSVINLRKNPDQRAELVSQAILGTPVRVLKEDDSWLLIQTPDNYISWTEKSSVELISRSDFTSWKKAEKVIYTEPAGWIYTEPGIRTTIGDIVEGSILENTGESNGYLFVKLPDGRKGVVKKDETQSFETFCQSSAFNAETILSTASALTGIPYLWGGRSSKGTDCSGFVQSVYFMNGLILQRDASLQALHGAEVDISRGYDLLKKGDLLFFGTKKNGKDHVTHVAIFIGNNEYINASSRVIVNSLDSAKENFSSYKKNSLLAARRILGAAADQGIIPVSQHTWYR
jgi:cell wall-associated NlpC family hydrolase